MTHSYKAQCYKKLCFLFKKDGTLRNRLLFVLPFLARFTAQQRLSQFKSPVPNLPSFTCVTVLLCTSSMSNKRKGPVPNCWRSLVATVLGIKTQAMWWEIIFQGSILPLQIFGKEWVCFFHPSILTFRDCHISSCVLWPACVPSAE